METIKLGHNLNLLKWYVNTMPINKNAVNKLYNMFTFAYDENAEVFMHILMYIAGTRRQYNDVYYRLTLHYLATNYPNKLLANIVELIKHGYTNDLLYLSQEDTIKNQIETFIKYKKLVIPDNIEYIRKFKYKLKKNNYKQLLKKIIFDKNINIL